MVAPALAGIHHVFTSSAEACHNCSGHAESAHLISDTTSITSILLDYTHAKVKEATKTTPAEYELPSMAPEHVVPFLIKKLKWRVVDVSQQSLHGRNVGNVDMLIQRSTEIW